VSINKDVYFWRFAHSKGYSPENSVAQTAIALSFSGNAL
jgi:hypothetical protein